MWSTTANTDPSRRRFSSLGTPSNRSVSLRSSGSSPGTATLSNLTRPDTALTYGSPNDADKLVALGVQLHSPAVLHRPYTGRPRPSTAGTARRSTGKSTDAPAAATAATFRSPSTKLIGVRAPSSPPLGLPVGLGAGCVKKEEGEGGGGVLDE